MPRYALSVLALIAVVVSILTTPASALAQEAKRFTLTAGSPPVDVRAGSDHIALLSVRSDDQPAEGVEVAWDLTGGSNSGQGGVAVSNAAGIVRVDVNTSKLVPGGGTDTLTAWIDANRNGQRDSDEVSTQVQLRTLPSANRPPVAMPQNVTVEAGSSVDIELVGNDPDGQRIGYAITRMPSHGSVPAYLDGPYLTYTPVAGYSGEDSFDFGVTDASGSTSTATVSITVRSPQVKPTCEGKVATIVAQPGQTVIVGTNGDDVIVGSERTEWIYGLGGNDTICGNGGEDMIYGGDGADVLVLSGVGGVVYGGDGNDTIHARGVGGWLFGGNGDDTMYGGDPVNNFYGSDGNDTISVGSGASIVSGGNGDDTLKTTGNATLWGGEGLDHLIWPGRERRD